MIEAPPILNILLLQGSDFSLAFQLKSKTVTRCAVTSSITPATIKIEQIGVTMFAGDRLTVGCDDLILASGLTPNDRVINVTSIPSSIPNGSVLIGSPIDITGWTFAGKLKTLLGADLATFIVTADINGIFRASILKSITTNLTSNCVWQDYQGFDLQSLGQPLDAYKDILSTDALKRFKTLSAAAYKWDIESTDTNSKTLRRVEGLALVSGEVTTV